MNRPLNNIFIKYLNDDCDEAEIATLLQHFRLQEEEVVIKELILAELENEQQRYMPPDIDKRLTAIHRRIQQHQHAVAVPPAINRPRVFVRVAAAAAVLLLAAASYFWLVPEKPAQQPAATADNAIKPGRNQAILTTSDGATINLTDASAGRLAADQGMLIEKTADGQVIYKNENGKTTTGAVVYNTIQTPMGGQWHLVLPDRTQVWLNANSTLNYPVMFTGKERVVQLTGEAYFEVSPDKQAPFKVTSGNQTVAVLGTAFNIMAYPNEKQIATTLLSGSVKVAWGRQSQTLLPGEQTQLLNQQLHLAKGVDTEQVIAWKNGYFKFNGNIEEIMNQVARWYDVEVEYSGTVDKSRKYQGEISRTRDLPEVLHIIEYAGNVHFRINKRRITVTP